MYQGQNPLSPGSQRNLTVRSWAPLSTAHTSREHKNIARYWIFRCQILILSQVWGQHTDAPWNFACARMFSFFLAWIPPWVPPPTAQVNPGAPATSSLCPIEWINCKSPCREGGHFEGCGQSFFIQTLVTSRCLIKVATYTPTRRSIY